MSKDILRDLRGFGTVEKWVLTDPKISISAKGLYALLCAFAGDKGHAFPGTELLSHQLNISKPTLQKVIKELKDHGVVHVEQVRRDGRFGHNVYSLLPKGYIPTVVKNFDNGKADDSNTDDSNLNTKNNSPNTNSLNSNSNKNTSSSNDDRSPYSESFERWWAIYPRKLSKGRAWKIWKQDKLDKRVDELIEKLQQQVAIQYSQTETKYIPHPSTYLSDGRYDDEVEQIKGVSNGITANSNINVPHGVAAQEQFAKAALEAYERSRYDNDDPL